MQQSLSWRIVLLAACFPCHGIPAHAEDWPTWRGDAQRSGATAEKLPAKLSLHWSLQLPAPRPAWPKEQGKVRFDTSYSPVAAAGRLFVPSMVRDCVSAYDLKTGQRLWRFYADGPVRFAPTVAGDRVLFVSDDGFLYCLRAENGKLIWKFRGGPSDRLVLGNDRLISMWPARGAPVVEDGTVYFAASIWPFMGIFVHALDLESGQPIWTNSGSGANYIVQPHNSPAFAGVAPQGHLAVTDQLLLVPGGMAVPAAFDRKTGQFKYFRPGERTLGKNVGGYEVIAGPDWYWCQGGLYQAADGKPLVKLDVSMVGKKHALGISGKKLVSLRRRLATSETTVRDRRGRAKKGLGQTLVRNWQADLPDGVTRLHVQMPDQVVASDGGSRVMLLSVPKAGKGSCHIDWQATVDGRVWEVLVTDGRLVVVTEAGTIHCFGNAESTPANEVVWDESRVASLEAKLSKPAESKVTAILSSTPSRAGYALVQNDDLLALCLAARTDFHVILCVEDAERCEQVRRELDAQGWLGDPIAVRPGRIGQLPLPAYMADLIVAAISDNIATRIQDVILDGICQSLRPYSGTAVIGCPASTRARLRSRLSEKQAEMRVMPQDTGIVVQRLGPLPGAGRWTQQNGDPGNTLVSPDRRVKLPLGLLWFGGPSNRDVLPRHGHGPTPQVVGGRLFIEGRDMLRAVDVYTGRLLWQRSFKDVGVFYDHTGHQPGAGAIGGNFASVADSVYLMWRRKCLRLDSATGRTLAELSLPPDASGEYPYWGFVGIEGNWLVAGSSPMVLLSESPGYRPPKSIYTQFGEGSRRIVVMDRFSGKVKWSHDAQYNFRHNAIAIGDGKVFCLDRMTDARLARLRRRGLETKAEFCLYALELATGNVVWKSTEHVFGTWLAFQAERKLLLQAGSRNRDRASDETGHGMAMQDAATGRLLWRTDDEYGGPPMFYRDTIVTQGAAYDVMTGQRKNRQHPITGVSLPWNFARNYGCNTAIGCTNLLTFRSAAAGYFDLAHDGGTGNLGGFRSSCTANLIAADGLLNAPDYTRTCDCSYQNQCSLALVTMPKVEMWTFNAILPSGARVERIGINFGAPGDRKAANGTLWLDYPSVGGPSPDVPVTVKGPRVTYPRRHSSLVSARKLAWVYASGVRGAERITIRLGPKGVPAAYQVRLYFSAPLAHSNGKLRVKLRGAETNSPATLQAIVDGTQPFVIKELQDVSVGEELEIRLEPLGKPDTSPTLCGIEIVRQD